MGIIHADIIKRKQARYVKALRTGCTHQLSADYAGVARETAWRWRKAGEAGEGPHVEFYELCQEAMGEAAFELVERIREHGERDWKADAWLLERRHPDQWSRHEHRTIAKDTVEVTVEPLEASADAVLDRLTPKK